MDDLEQKLNAVLNDPQMMQKLMSVAQSLGTQAPPTPDSPAQSNEGIPELDLGMLQKLSGLAQTSSIDKDQQALLRALRPYLSRERISKLEKAMRAAKMAKLASGFLGTRGLQL